jgi:hypothetical protein
MIWNITVITSVSLSELSYFINFLQQKIKSAIRFEMYFVYKIVNKQKTVSCNKSVSTHFNSSQVLMKTLRQILLVVWVCFITSLNAVLNSAPKEKDWKY